MNSLTERIQVYGRRASVLAMNADREAARLRDAAAHDPVVYGEGTEHVKTQRANQNLAEAAKLEAEALEFRRVAEYGARGFVFASQEHIRMGVMFRDDVGNALFSDAHAAGLVVFEEPGEAKLMSEATGTQYPT